MSSTVLPLQNGSASGAHALQKYGDMRDYRAPSLFQPSRVRQAIRDAHQRKIPPLVGLYVALPSVSVIRWIASMPFDTCWIDWEHSAMNIETMTTMVHETIFMSEGRMIPWVRVPGHDHGAIGHALDAGASIVVPQIDTVEQAKHAVGAVRYGLKAKGSRSAPPFRFLPGVADAKADPTATHHINMNQQHALMIQVESEQGVRNLDAILTECPEIDVVWFGRLDARVSMGLSTYDSPEPWDQPEWQELEKIYAETLKKHNKPHAGFSFGPREKYVEQVGTMSMVVTGADVQKLAELTGEAQIAKDALSVLKK